MPIPSARSGLQRSFAVLGLWANGTRSGAALAVTALTGRCSIYAMLGLSTCRAPGS
ncbi:MAG: YgaP family membrane protein [Salinarimonas sp.]